MNAPSQDLVASIQQQNIANAFYNAYIHDDKSIHVELYPASLVGPCTSVHGRDIEQAVRYPERLSLDARASTFTISQRTVIFVSSGAVEGRS